MYISEMQTPRKNAPSILDNTHLTTCKDYTRSSGKKSRSHSLDLLENCRTQDFLDRMRRTYEFGLKGFKGNVRGSHIHSPFTTLEELLRSVPESVGIDIELSNECPRPQTTYS